MSRTVLHEALMKSQSSSMATHIQEKSMQTEIKSCHNDERNEEFGL